LSRVSRLQRGVPEHLVQRPESSVWLVALAMLASAACTSRTLPLPPPEVRVVSAPDGDGYVSLSGLALEGASIGVVNDRTLAGVITTSPDDACDSACPWEARIQARVGDGLRVWQFFETSGGTEVIVRAR
jgi:hypothetical protein